MTIRTYVISTGLALAAGAAATPVRAEIAGYGLDPSGNGTYLLYVENDRVHRMECDRMSAVHDHGHCKDHPSSAPAGKFFALLPTKFATAFPLFEQDAQEAWIKLQQVDTRLFELVNSQVPTGTTPVTAEQVDAASRAVDAASLKLTDVRDQIGRLEADLADNRGDAADLEQLGVDRAHAIQLETERNAAAAALLALRKTYVEQRADTSGANFHDLIGLRNQQIDSYNRAKYYGGLEVKDMGCAELMASRLKETGFVWEAICNLSTSVPDSNLGGTLGRIGRAFEAVELADRTFTATGNGSRRVSLDVPRAGLIGGVHCDYPLGSADGHFQGELAVEAPGGLIAEIPLNNYGAKVVVNWTSVYTGSGHSAFDDAHFERHDGAGHWVFEFIPAMIVIGGGSGPADPLVCSVTLQNP